METLDTFDAKILNALQEDATLSLDVLAEIATLSRNAVWRRIKAMEERGIIKGRVLVIDPTTLGLNLSVFMLIRAGAHAPNWHERFSRATRVIPEILSAYRMTGDLDYMIHAKVRDMADYDRLYQRLIKEVEIADISASFVMEEIKSGTAITV